MRLTVLVSFIVVLFLADAVSVASVVIVHDGPDPIAHWTFGRRTVVDKRLESRLGPNGVLEGTFEVANDGYGILLNSSQSAIVLAEDFSTVKKFLPTGAMTVSAWVSINKRQEWGAIIGALQDNGGFEKGWVVGYGERHFYFGLSTEGASDGDGHMTYLHGTSEYELGKFYHLTVVYDGKTMQLFVNGTLEVESGEQSGDILYPESTPYVIGAYRDDNENHSHFGRLHDIAVYNLAAKPKWVAKEFAHHRRLADMVTTDIEQEAFKFVVPPFLQMVTKTSIVSAWQTTRVSSSVMRYGETSQVERVATDAKNGFIHHVTLQNLLPDTQYFYQVESVVASGEVIKSEVLTFQTAPEKNTPFAFAIISDTQGNPAVSGKIAEMAWAQRPSFLIHPGDLVSTGTNDMNWTDHFFPSMHPLIGRVAMFPVLGNHEVNARNYYDYFQLPDPEYYYEFEYGNAHFFMIDTNKKVDPESEQYRWLDEALGKCTAEWKFVVHHHPAYSSDSNDYGDLWTTNQGTHGDMRVRELTTLYDKHDVDIVWNGHIHSYERTWPVFEDQVTPNKGTVYMVTGGGGGGLEDAGPFRAYFQNNIYYGHHYCMAFISGTTLEFKAFDLEGRLFDYMKLEKKSMSAIE